MRSFRAFVLVIFSICAFWVIKFFFKFPSADIGIIGVILTVASVLFGFLAGFFISELWTRYTNIRELQGKRLSEGLNMIRYASYFYNNKNFEKEFKLLVEKSAVADEVINWDEGHLEIKYYQDIETSFSRIQVKTKKDQVYFDNLLDSYNEIVETIVRMDILYKERLFPTEWFMLVTLSLIITFSILFLDTSHFFYKVVVLVFPAIILLAMSVIYDLNTLVWSRGLVTLEPIQKSFDALGVKRYYIRKDEKYAPKGVEYRTEDDLVPELKKVYDDILSHRNS